MTSPELCLKKEASISQGGPILGWKYLFLTLCLSLSTLALQPPAQAVSNEEHLLETLLARLSKGEMVEADGVRFISHYRFDEVFEALVNGYHRELDRVQERKGALSHEENVALIDRLSEYNTAIYTLGTQFYHTRISGLDIRARRILNPHVYEALSPKLSEVFNTLKLRRDQLPSMGGSLVHPDKARSAPPNSQSLVKVAGSINEAYLVQLQIENRLRQPYIHLENLQQHLEKNIIGQPEVIQALMDMERRDLFHWGQRTRPQTLVFMGIPGTGKDTSVYAYMDALHGGMRGVGHDHIHQMSTARDKSDLWKNFGSAPGYVGSNELPELLRFLVKHSGGRYALEKTEGRGGEERVYVVENKDWSPGQVFPGYYPPEMGAIFINEFHNWSKEAKDLILKMALSDGYFPINNPGTKGVGKMYVPVKIFIATNEGQELIIPVGPNGLRTGPPMSFDSMLARYKDVRNDKNLLLDSLKYPAVNHGDSPTNSGGMSPETANRLPLHGLIMMRPLGPEDLSQILEIKLAQLAQDLEMNRGAFGHFKVQWTQELKDFLLSYHYNPESMARPLDYNIESLIQAPFYSMAAEGLFEDFPGKRLIQVGVKTNADRTTSLTVDIVDQSSGQAFHQIERLIHFTEQDRPQEPLSDQELEELNQLEDKLKARVFGVSHVAKKVAESILVSEESRRQKVDQYSATESARLFAFFGLTSSGKTEMAKVMADTIYGGEQHLLTLDFSQVESMEDLKKMVLGDRDKLGNVIPSEFMLHYDRHSGHCIIALDEIANAPKWVLRALYDVFNEAVVTTFSDRKPRVMSGVTLVLTGNAGQEWYQGIPRSLPDHVRMNAMDEIYQHALKNPGVRRETAAQYLPEPLLARIGESNIFFFPPNSFKTIRELTLLKLSQTLKSLEPQDSSRGWRFTFDNQESFQKLVEVIEQEGFVIDDQGRSVTWYITKDLKNALRAELLREKVASGTEVVLAVKKPRKNDREITYTLTLPTSRTLEVSLPRREKAEGPQITDAYRLMTAYHEAGHELVHSVLTPEHPSRYLSVVDGVAFIGGRPIYYAGVAEHELNVALNRGLSQVIDEIAVFTAGYLGEQFVSKGQQDYDGKSNDMERATELAYNAILRWGLSDNWGKGAIPSSLSTQDYIQTLSPEKRHLLEQEVGHLIRQGEERAKLVILANQEVFLDLGRTLAEKGEMHKGDLKKFYASQPSLVHPFDVAATLDQWPKDPESVKHRRAEIREDIPRPKRIAKVESLIAKKRQAQVSEVPWPEAPLLSPQEPEISDCQALLTQ